MSEAQATEMAESVPVEEWSGELLVGARLIIMFTHIKQP